MDRSSGAIRTPDQRLRVFVSSTLKELAAERKASRTAIERLHLAPVMFELGARPHPPRELYRAYLAQSDIFVGLYWENYGWVAPGEDVSGLEDEYNLAQGVPKLIYIKDPATGREPRLTELLDRIRTDDTVSFKSFSDPRELGRLITADVATLLAERFDQSVATSAPGQAAPTTTDVSTDQPSAIPVALTELIGREAEVQHIMRVLRAGPARLITLIGPGGIGKSRLAIDVAGRVDEEPHEHVVFIDMSSVHDPGLVPTAIADALGVQDTGDRPLDDKLKTALRDRRVLLVLDNFEQVLDAAPLLTTLLASAAGLRFLVTSRTRLRVSAEYAFEVGPLELPDVTRSPSIADVLTVPSVALFVERAHAVKPDFELTGGNVEAVAKICVALDGVPLALELAAARVRVLPPTAMLERLDRRLALLSGGVRNLPERQQTLRATIDWSTQLLGAGERELLAQLGVFEGGFALDAAEQVTGTDTGVDALTLLGGLVDSSLVRQQDRGDRPYFTMLATVREYAVEQLEASGRLGELRRRHADYFVQLGLTAEPGLEGAGQRDWVTRLAEDRDNLRATARYLLDEHDYDAAAEFAWDLYMYWWVAGHLGDVRRWMDEVLASGESLSDHTRAIALYFTRAITFWQDPDELVMPGLEESAALFHREQQVASEALALVSLALSMLASAEPNPAKAQQTLERSLGLFRGIHDRWGEAMALVTLGRVSLLQQDVPAALSQFEQSLALTRQQQDELGESIALHHLAWSHLLLGELDKARGEFESSLALSEHLGHAEGVAYGLEGLVAIAASDREPERAGRLFGAAQCLRERSGLYDAPTFTFHQRFVDSILAGENAGEFERSRLAGRTLAVDDAVQYALSVRAR
ncbi:DUF4062 domain-containing protein [Salinibacterium sp. ZJ450]|uniref:DUF4062 domain-containing protein n=1 Tax=Salinibacterium sp. ZJ450 TaxID=2708338 RepID=UPI0014220440|nr:DUF4062 domain-containing protein [Salinibacterium sp. ZJ450]